MLKLKLFVSLLFVTIFASSYAYAQTVDTVYPGSICDTANLLDDNSENSHVDKSTNAVLGFGETNPITQVYCPLARMKPLGTDRVRITLDLLRETQREVECIFAHRTRNGLPFANIVESLPAGTGPVGNLRFVANFETTRRNGTFGVLCRFASSFDVTLYTFRVREF